MNITIKATQYQLSDASRTLVEQKLGTLAKFLGSDAAGAQLGVEIEQAIGVVRAGAAFRTEGNLSVGGKLYRAEALGDTLEGSLDKLRGELEGEVRRSRGKSRDLLKRGGAAVKAMLRGWR